ncbi:hypothetical protein CUU62_24475 [Pseudomonas sp. WP001]|nr:hypothetical protein CUU62_24475 [Pseudomonas sp. WP001]
MQVFCQVIKGPPGSIAGVRAAESWQLQIVIGDVRVNLLLFIQAQRHRPTQGTLEVAIGRGQQDVMLEVFNKDFYLIFRFRNLTAAIGDEFFNADIILGRQLRVLEVPGSGVNLYVVTLQKLLDPGFFDALGSLGRLRLGDEMRPGVSGLGRGAECLAQLLEQSIFIVDIAQRLLLPLERLFRSPLKLCA